jgi:signal peptidase I
MDNEININYEGKSSLFKSLWELVRFAILAIVIVLPIRMFIAEPFVVSGSSMAPTFSLWLT